MVNKNVQLYRQVAINNMYENNLSKKLLVINDMYNEDLNKKLSIINNTRLSFIVW